MKDLKIKTFNFLDAINNYSLKILKLSIFLSCKLVTTK